MHRTKRQFLCCPLNHHSCRGRCWAVWFSLYVRFAFPPREADPCLIIQINGQRFIDVLLFCIRQKVNFARLYLYHLQVLFEIYNNFYLCTARHTDWLDIHEWSHKNMWYHFHYNHQDDQKSVIPSGWTRSALSDGARLIGSGWGKCFHVISWCADNEKMKCRVTFSWKLSSWHDNYCCCRALFYLYQQRKLHANI